jgi:hypothetical protein
MHGTPVERGKPIMPLEPGKPLVRETDGMVGKGGGRKRRPSCNGVDRGGNSPSRESEQTSLWSLSARAFD